MILEYTYDNGLAVLDLFKQSALATLSIQTVKDDNTDEPRFIIEYSLTESYDVLTQSKIRKVLESSLKERLKLVNVLNQFIENAILGNIKTFSLTFNAVNVRKCQILYSSSSSGTKPITKASVQDLVKCLAELDRIIVDMGIYDQAVPGMFKKDGSGKGKKYAQLTIQEISTGLRKTLTEE